MLQTMTTWTTDGGGSVTAQPERRYPEAVLLQSANPSDFDQFDSAPFANPRDLLVSVTFRGGYHAVYFELSTSRGRRQFKFTPDRQRLSLVFGYRYAMGMGTRAKNGYWHTFEYDLGALAAQAEPGIVVNEITAHFVRFAGTLVAAPTRNRPGVDQPGPDPTATPTPVPDPTATPTPEPTATPEPTPTPTAPGPNGPASRADAARFLLQATFGPTEESIDELMAIGNFDAWISRQFALPMSETLPYTQANSNGSLGTTRHEVWWNNAMGEPDQLRQRVAFALSRDLRQRLRAEQLAVRRLPVLRHARPLGHRQLSGPADRRHAAPGDGHLPEHAA